MKRCKCCCRCTNGEYSDSTESDEYNSTDMDIEENMLNHRRAQNSRQRAQKKVEAKQALQRLKVAESEGSEKEGPSNEPGPPLPKNKLISRVKYFSEHTTMHGLDQVYTSGSIVTKVFWLCVLVAVLGIVIWQLYKMVKFFLEAHTLTSISVVYPDDGIEFPSFTICPLMKLNGTRLKTNYKHITDKVAEFSTASFLSAYSTALMDVQYFGPMNESDAIIDDLQKQLDESLKDQTLRQFIEDTAFDCEGQFLYCWFENGKLFNCCNQNQTDTGVKVKVKRYLLHSGPCFEFESQGMKQRLPGPVGGFGFVYWYPNKDVQKTVFNSYDEHAIHMFTSPTEAMLEKSPIALQVGTHSHISLQATKMTRQLEDQLGRTMCAPKNLTYFSEYSYPSCQAECLIDGMLRKCNCTGVSTYANLPPEARICSPKEAFLCYKQLAKQFTHMLTQCRREKCSEACMYWKYKPSLTVGRVFNPNIEEEMLKYWRLPNISDPSLSLIIADVYFNDIEYTDIQQMPAVTIESFISNIGGAMGLWTGASIITWIHLCFFCGSAWCMHREEKVERESIRKASQANKKRASHRTRRRVANDSDFAGNRPPPSYPPGAYPPGHYPPFNQQDSQNGSHRDLPDGSSLARQKLRNSKIILTPPYDDTTTDIVV